MNASTLGAALAAAARGWHIFPLTPHTKTPLRGFTQWEAHATNDPERIAAFWAHGRYNVGVACGPSGLVVIDLDMPKPGETPPADAVRDGVTCGEQVFRLLCERRGRSYPGDTLTVRTRRGGLHLYFAAPEGVRLGNTAGRNAGGLGWLIDTRAWGGQVVAAGSYVSLPDGKGPYDIIHDTPPAPLPDWLTEALTPAPPPAPSGDLLANLPGHRLSKYGETALQAEADRVASAPGGSRNYALNLAAFNLGQLVTRRVLPEQAVIGALTRAAELANHRHPDRTPNSPREITAVIASGLRAGMTAQPRRRKAAPAPPRETRP
ncbi:bifunctional DNA primase/polymerase [Nonomuraea angiospora]|uniref:bifunctional DNA primase/polymerase n=1 Tax=Nonomuraea angiospora TaxID=46172 RepID=UPI0033D6975B